MPFVPEQMVPQPNDVFVIGGAATTSVMTNDVELCSPTILPRMVIKAITLRVTSAGTAGSVIRVGLRQVVSQQYPQPGNLIADLGTQVGTSVATLTYTPTSIFIWPGGILYVTATSQGSPATPPTIRSTSSPEINTPLANTVTDPASRYYAQSGQTGALALTFTPNINGSVGPLMAIVAGDFKDVRYGPYA